MTKRRYDEIFKMRPEDLGNLSREEWEEFLSYLTGTSPVGFEHHDAAGGARL